MHAFTQVPPLAFLQNLGPWEVGLLVLLALLLFGGKKLPELARGLGRSIKEFREASSEAEKNFKGAMHEAAEKEQNDDSSAKASPEQGKPSDDDTPRQI